jgi:hypothetical protein
MLYGFKESIKDFNFEEIRAVDGLMAEIERFGELCASEGNRK